MYVEVCIYIEFKGIKNKYCYWRFKVMSEFRGYYVKWNKIDMEI